MRFQIVSIADRGMPNRERLHLRALADGDLAYLVVFLTHYTGAGADKVLSGIGAAYWFPAKAVKAGDSIVLYSGNGANTETRNIDGSTNHFFYWGMTNTVWHDATATILLFEVYEWQAAPRPGPTPVME